LLGMRPLLQDEIAERHGRRTDEGGIAADTPDGPVIVTAMAGWHVIGGGCVLAVAARSHVDGDPFALDEDLHGAAGEPHLDLAAREPVGDAIEMALDIDVVVDTDTAHAPFGEDIGFGRHGLERWPIEFFEQLPAGQPEPADRSLLVEPLEQLADHENDFRRSAIAAISRALHRGDGRYQGCRDVPAMVLSRWAVL
jgi:hypothetical protein